jgi:hypothetical protein
LGNTVGRTKQMDEVTKAYIAGFLDGDGSIFFQLVKHKDYVFGYQIRASLAFYQHVSAAHILDWLKNQLGNIGYIRQRGNMKDYTIVGWKNVQKILQDLQPYVKLKKPQVDLALNILVNARKNLSIPDFLTLCRKVDEFKGLNYSKKRSQTVERVIEYLTERSLFPVTTDPKSYSGTNGEIVVIEKIFEN